MPSQSIVPIPSGLRLVAVVSGAYSYSDDEGETATDLFPVVAIVADRQYDALVASDGGFYPLSSYGGPGKATEIVPCYWPQHEDRERLKLIIERMEAYAWKSRRRHDAKVPKASVAG